MLVFGAALVAAASDWPGYRGPNHNGISTESGWLGAWPGGQPATLWKKNVGIGFASVAVSSGKVYTLGNRDKSDTVYCFNAESGGDLWKYSYAEDLDPKYYEGGPSATPTIVDGAVYTFSKSGRALCLDASTGAVRWNVAVAKDLDLINPDWGFAGSPFVQEGLVILNAGRHGLALDARDGKVVWTTGKDAAGYASPTPFRDNDREVLAMFGAKTVAAVDPKNGAVIWEYPWKTSYDVNSADPIVSRDLMFLSSGYGTGGAALKLGGAKPTQLWFNKEVKSHFQTGVAVDGRIYAVDGQGGDRNSRLKCLDFATGKVLWTSPEAATGTVCAADHRIIWLTGDGQLVIVEARADEYKERARAQVIGGKCWTAPVLANGRLYVRNARGDVVCVDIKGAGPVL